MEIKLLKLNCKRCGHSWIPRITEITVCPKCKSPYWNREKDTESRHRIETEDWDCGIGMSTANLNFLLNNLPFIDEFIRADYSELAEPKIDGITEKGALVNNIWLPRSQMRTDGNVIYVKHWLYDRSFL